MNKQAYPKDDFPKNIWDAREDTTAYHAEGSIKKSQALSRLSSVVTPQEDEDVNKQGLLNVCIGHCRGLLEERFNLGLGVIGEAHDETAHFHADVTLFLQLLHESLHPALVYLPQEVLVRGSPVERENVKAKL